MRDPAQPDGPGALWRRVLLVEALVFCGMGIFWAVTGRVDPLGLWQSSAAGSLFPGAGESFPEDVEHYHRFLLGPFGATSAAYFGLVLLIVWHLFPGGQRQVEPTLARWAWSAVAGSFLLWFTVDTLASLARGGLFNVLLVNLPALVAFGLPLVALRRHLH